MVLAGSMDAVCATSALVGQPARSPCASKSAMATGIVSARIAVLENVFAITALPATLATLRFATQKTASTVTALKAFVTVKKDIPATPAKIRFVPLQKVMGFHAAEMAHADVANAYVTTATRERTAPC